MFNTSFNYPEFGRIRKQGACLSKIITDFKVVEFNHFKRKF